MHDKTDDAYLIQVPTNSFDISSVYQIRHANALCKNCKAMLLLYPLLRPSYKCPVCSVTYISSLEKRFILENFLDSEGHSIKYQNQSQLIEHCRKLALICHQIKTKQFTPVRGLYTLLAAAKKFIHFTTYGISPVFIGALKTVAQKITVRGIVSAAGNAVEELSVTEDAPFFEVKVFGKENNISIPHQKIIIIDGLVAIKGSTNLTISGWRKAEQGLDMIDIVTDIGEVAKINNTYFSPVWARTENVEEIDVHELPF